MLRGAAGAEALANAAVLPMDDAATDAAAMASRMPTQGGQRHRARLLHEPDPAAQCRSPVHHGAEQQPAGRLRFPAGGASS